MENKEYINCQQLRDWWGRYDVGGILYNTIPERSKEAFINSVNKQKKEYADKGCGKDVLMEKCLEREAFLTSTRNNISSRNQAGNLNTIESWNKILTEETKKFQDLGCPKKIEENRQVAVSKTIDKYSELDKKRIEAESKYQQKIRIFMGATVLIIVLTTIFLFKTKK
jgi:hypothetical protein